MKALEILRDNYISVVSDTDKEMALYYQDHIQIAIAELESLENRSCSSCQYAKLDTKRYLASHICLLGVNAIDFDFSCNKWESK